MDLSGLISFQCFVQCIIVHSFSLTLQKFQNNLQQQQKQQVSSGFILYFCSLFISTLDLFFPFFKDDLMVFAPQTELTSEPVQDVSKR